MRLDAPNATADRLDCGLRTTPLMRASSSNHAPQRSPGAATSEAIDWAAVREEVVEHLRQILRFDTTNPPGNELPLGCYLESVLTRAGIETQLLEPAPGRAAVVARITGSGERQPVVLLAHMDVVAVERERWSVDPFGGEVRDGYVYGRGAIDDKGMLATNLMAMLLLQRADADRRAALRRDVIFVATSDEETGGRYGIEWLIEHHPDLIRGEFALNEGGRIRIVNGQPLYAAVQTAEKISHIVTVVANGPVGHASIPIGGNAIARLARALAAIAAHKESAVLLPTTRRFFADLSAVWPEHSQAQAMADVASDQTGAIDRGTAVLEQIPVFNAVLRSGISPTVLQAGLQTNVIPAEARATLNVRTLPGSSVDELVERLRAIVADEHIDITVTARGTDAPASNFESPMFTAIAAVLRELLPSIITVPYLSTGATDSARLRAWGMQAFGLLPFPLAEVDEKRMHGHDERVPVEGLEFGTRLTFESVRRVATGVE